MELINKYNIYINKYNDLFDSLHVNKYSLLNLNIVSVKLHCFTHTLNLKNRGLYLTYRYNCTTATPL